MANYTNLSPIGSTPMKGLCPPDWLNPSKAPSTAASISSSGGSVCVCVGGEGYTIV